MNDTKHCQFYVLIWVLLVELFEERRTNGMVLMKQKCAGLSIRGLV
jgi:hypothetical protein